MSSIWTAEIWLAIRTDGMLGTGIPSDPYDASSPSLFDTLMDNFGNNTTVHLGPGIYQTRGYAPGTYYHHDATHPGPQVGWVPRSGQKIIGAGIDVTVLKLVDATDSVNQTLAVSGNNILDGFEISDLTIDCNLDGQPILSGNFPVVCVGAINIVGRHTRIRRVRAINFGTLSSHECFVIVAANANPSIPETYDCLIEECIIEKPSVNNTYTVTCTGFIAGENGGGVPAFHRACAVRNCYINCEYVDNPVALAGITFSGMTATLTTKSPHNRFPGQWLIVSGALENGVPSTNYNGSFQITAVLSPTQLQFTTPAIPTCQPTGEMYIGRFSSQNIAFDNHDWAHNPPLTRAGSGPDYTLTLTTLTPHNRVPGNNVCLTNVTGGALVNGASIFNGSFLVTQVLSPTQLQFKLTSAADPGQPDHSQPNAFIGIYYQALGIDVGQGGIAEGNRVYNCRVALYHDSWSTKDSWMRNNYCYAVVLGAFHLLGRCSPGNPTVTRAFVSLTSSLTISGPVATLTTGSPHGLVAGQPVTIQNAKVGGTTNNPYNGTFPIISAPSPTQFTYAISALTASADVSAAAFGALWQVGRMLVEDNVLDLVLNIIPSGAGSPAGVLLSISVGFSAFIFQQVLVRGNLIRSTDNAFDSSGVAVGVNLAACANTVVDQNIVNLNALSFGPNPIVQTLCGSAAYCNNQTSAGGLIQGYNIDAAQSLNEIASNADLAASKSS
jgi:hypothetical protein